MDMDMDGKFHIHGNPGHHTPCRTTTHVGHGLRTTECWQLTFQSTTRVNPRRSAKRDRHGAFKLKPSEARFQLVLDNARWCNFINLSVVLCKMHSRYDIIRWCLTLARLSATPCCRSNCQPIQCLMLFKQIVHGLYLPHPIFQYIAAVNLFSNLSRLVLLNVLCW